MRKSMAVVSVVAMVLMGFTAFYLVGAAEEPKKYCFTFEKYFFLEYTDDCDGVVEVGEEAWWWFTIRVQNNMKDTTMYNVVVTDNLGGELEVNDQGYCDYWKGKLTITLRGETEKVSFKWEIGDLAPGEEAHLHLKVSTDINPGGHQSYTSPGEKQLNSGAVLKFMVEHKTGYKQVSAHTESIRIYVPWDDTP